MSISLFIFIYLSIFAFKLWNLFFLNSNYLTYRVMLVSGVQYSDSTFHTTPCAHHGKCPP